MRPYDLAVALAPAKALLMSTGPHVAATTGCDMRFRVHRHSGVGLRLAPYAQMDDGKIDLMYTPSAIKSVLKALKLDGMIKSKGKHVNDSLVAYSQAADSIELTCDAAPQRVMVDGELVGFTPVKMRVMPSAFKLFTFEVAGKC